MKYIQTKKWIGLNLNRIRTSHRSHHDDGLCMKEKAQIWARLQSVTGREEGAGLLIKGHKRSMPSLGWYICIQADPPPRPGPIAQTRKSAARKHLRTGWFARRGIMSEKSQLWTLMLRINGAPHYADFKRKESESEGDTHSLIAFQNAASHEADVLNDGPGVSTVKKCVLWVRGETHADSGSLRKEKRKRRESAAPTGSLHTVQRR